jgi:hypothetical protein
MPTIEEAKPSNGSAAQTCPLCGAPLDPANPNACTQCDWVAKTDETQSAGTVRDKIAVVLSVVPGLGHIYKGHRLTGALYFLGAVIAISACLVAGTFTAGFALLLMPLYWLGIMLQVYFLEDLVLAEAKKK